MGDYKKLKIKNKNASKEEKMIHNNTIKDNYKAKQLKALSMFLFLSPRARG